MEDSITETELRTRTEDFNQVHDEVMKPSESSGKSKQEEVEEGSKRSVGIINHLISNLVTPSPRSPRGLSNVFATTEANSKEDEDKSEKKRSDQDVEMGGGIINNLISNIFQSGGNTEGDQGEVKEYRNNIEGVTDVEGNKYQDHEQVEVNGGSAGGGGIINNLVTNFFHQNESEVSHEGGVQESEGEEHKAVSSEGSGEHVKIEEEKSNGIGGIISNLVSNLEETYDPANDEASIMIHSIIHD